MSMTTEEAPAVDLASLPPVSSSLHAGHVFGKKELFALLDAFHLPVALIDAWNGNWVHVIWINKKHVEVLGENDREYYLANINKRGAAATATFEQRLQMWKEKVQIRLGFHTDPQKLFPDVGAPIPHFTRMLPVNVDLGDRKGVFALAVHIPENSYNTPGHARASDAFKYCRTMVSMFAEAGETVWMNSAAEEFFTTGVGLRLSPKNRLAEMLAHTVNEIGQLESMIEQKSAGGSVTFDDTASAKSHNSGQSSVLSNDESESTAQTARSGSVSNAYESMKQKVFEDGKTFLATVQVTKTKYHKLTITCGVDPVSGAKVAVCCQDDVTGIRAIHQAATDLEDMNHRKDMLFANMSHELKTPLNGIIAMTEVLMEDLNGVIDEDSKWNLENIRVSGQRLNNLVTNLLDASLLKNKKLAVKMVDDVNLHKLAENILFLSRTVNHVAKKDDVKLLNKVDVNFRAFKCDEVRLAQILSNLVNNSLKFTSVGNITVSAEMAVSNGRKTVRISVEDTGIGIAQKDQKKIFESLRQVEEDADRTFGGTGLGLTIARDLSIAMGGGIDLESEVGRGSKFTVYFPSDLDEIQPRTHRTSSNASSATSRAPSISSKTSRKASSARKLSINSPKSTGETTGQIELLSVDDEPTNQAVVRATLKKNGYRITAAMNGEEALGILQNRLDNKEPFPDIILLDVMMPKMNGFETCSKIRSMFPLCAIPIIMVSAKNREENIVQGLNCGANDYVTKPFAKLELIARIDTQLQLRQSWSAELEREKSDVLLHQMLPEHVIGQLKDREDTDGSLKGGRAIVEQHNHACILFSDVVGFTALSASIPTLDIIQMLNGMFSAFDDLTNKHGVYKVETIGDAYMVAAGHAPGETKEESITKILAFARDMLQAIERMNTEWPDDRPRLQIRVGIHCGPCHTGVVGTKMPRFCFFGDTVNTASRMESNGFPSCVHVSGDFYEAAKGIPGTKWHLFGEREIKGKGSMSTYLQELGMWEEALKKRNEQDDNVSEATALAESYNRAKFRKFSLGALSSGVDMLGVKESESHVKELEDEIRSLRDQNDRLRRENRTLKKRETEQRNMLSPKGIESQAPNTPNTAGGSNFFMTPLKYGGGEETDDIVVRLGADPEKWDDSDVSFWLCWKSVYLGAQYAQEFRASSINGQMLLALTDTDLKDALGVNNALHRKRILKDIDVLRGRVAALRADEENMDDTDSSGENMDEQNGTLGNK